jgi:hypothetical protein
MSSIPSLTAQQPPDDHPPVDPLPKLLCGFSLAELLHAMPPTAPATSVSLTKPEHLDQSAIDRLMSPEEPSAITPFSTPSGPAGRR